MTKPIVATSYIHVDLLVVALPETMATFFIRRLRESQQEKFRWAPQPSTTTAMTLRPGDYRDDGEVEADSPYQAWQLLRQSNRDLRVGDALVDEGGAVHLCRFTGFETAAWAIADMESQDTGPVVAMQGNQGG